MKFLKKLTVLALIVCFSVVPMFAGCDLFTLNQGMYLKQPVATVDDTTTITMEELINAYSSYGNSTYDSSSTVTKKGIESTLDLLVNRAVLVDYLTDEEKSGSEYISLTTAEKNDIWRNVYKYFNEQISKIETTLRTDAGLTTSSDTSSSDSTKATYSAYTKTYTLVSVNGQYVLQQVVDPTTVENDSVAPYDESDTTLTEEQKAEDTYNNFRKYHWDYTDSHINDAEGTTNTAVSYSDKAMIKFIKNLIKAESGENLDTVTENVFMREVKRVYKNYYENEILTVYQNNFDANVNITTDMVVAKYKELYAAQCETYNVRSAQYTTDMNSTSTTVYYQADPSDWFRVSHILVKYTDDENTEMTNWATKLNNQGCTLAEYNEALTEIKSRALNSATKILNELKTKLSQATSTEEKFSIFQDYAYLYSEDTASLGLENDMAISRTGKDSMVEAFQDASKELSDGQEGDISNCVESTYGFHIIMYLGEFEDISTSLNNNALLAKLDVSQLSKLTNKTMLDKVIESISLSTYSNHETQLLKVLKKDLTITYYPDAYKVLYS